MPKQETLSVKETLCGLWSNLLWNLRLFQYSGWPLNDYRFKFSTENKTWTLQIDVKNKKWCLNITEQTNTEKVKDKVNPYIHLKHKSNLIKQITLTLKKNLIEQKKPMKANQCESTLKNIVGCLFVTAVD